MAIASDSLPKLNRDEAIALLSIHAFTSDHPDDPRLERSLVGSLRPFTQLYPESFHELMACIKCLGPDLGSDRISRDLVAQIWSIWHSLFVYIQDHAGELRGGIVSDQDVKTVDIWVGCMSSAVMMYLDGGSTDSAFEWYNECFDT